MNFAALKRVIGEFKPYKPQIIIVLALGLVISAIQPISVKLSQRIIDELQKGTFIQGPFLKQVPALLIGVFIVSGFAKYFHNTLRRYVSERVIIKYRTLLFEKYLNFPLSVLDKTRAGDFLSNIQNDLSKISIGIDTLILVLKEPFTFIGLLGAAFYCDWRLALSTLLVAPLVAFLFSKSGSAVKRYSHKNLETFSDLMSISQESISGARVVKVFQLEVPLFKKFQTIQENYFHIMMKAIRVEELATPVVELIGALLISGVIIYGGHRASLGLLTPGQLVGFIIAIGLAQMPLKQLNNAYLKLKTAEAAAERIYSILDKAQSSPRTEGSQNIKTLNSSITFNNVSLLYDDKPALKNISFEIKRGDCVAFVGHSGSGKSSVVNLLPRLYEVTSGEILFDGVSIKNLLLPELRKLISFVTQDTFLFNDSLYENIRYGNPNASDKEIKRAAEQAHCADFISRLRDGFNTRIGDRGVCLSGGERQRVAIARAFLRSSPILVLDEATSSLDSQSEAVVQDAMEELIEGKTTFMVAHRLSTIKKASRIFVMDQGNIVESGTHETLVRLNGAYRQFYERQVGGRLESVSTTVETI
ncbi:MAG: ABC transporter ATP-binding protein [Proteobacteria bacterium]|nr:ABC transporter ATP-binding protein [Pseudomonadota bacterium]